MVSGNGKLPSLADTIAAVRRELSSAQAAGRGQAVAVPGRAGGAGVRGRGDPHSRRAGGVQIWVLTLGGKAELGQATTQRIKVTLHPVDPGTGQDARIADPGQGREPAGPPP